MFRNYYVHTISNTAYLDTIFKEIPNNAFINKGRCGIGGTTLELLNKLRSSIIVAPTCGILHGKQVDHPDLYIIDGDVNQVEIEEQLAKRLPAQKIMVTPDSFGKLMKAIVKQGLWVPVTTTWFLLLDECHSFITEAFRKNILIPLSYFWDFENKAIISAIPYIFTNPKFKELDSYKIDFKEKLGVVTLVNCCSVRATLNEVLLNADYRRGKLHIFYNSVKAIVEAVKLADLDNVSIYCANDKDKQNMIKLGDYSKYYHELPSEANFSNVNFYTCKYFEGIDIEDKNATVIVVTDIYQPHTKVSVNMKLKQAVGRLRNKPSRIIHLTNHHNQDGNIRGLVELQEVFKSEAELLIKQQLEYIELCKLKGLAVDVRERLDRFATINKVTNIPTFNYELFDQVVNEAHSDEMYNDIKHLKADWERGYYEVHLTNSYTKLETQTIMKRKSKATILKEDIEALRAYKQETQNKIIFHLGKSVEQEIKARNYLAYEAEALLSVSRLEELRYNYIKVQQEVIVASNLQAEHKLLKLMAQVFKVGQRYSRAFIKKQLETIYEKLNLRDSKGCVLKANATDLAEVGRFCVNECKMKETGENGYEIMSKQFRMAIAA